MSHIEVGSLDDVYAALGKDKADKLVAVAIGYSATTSTDETLAAVRAGRAVELEEFMDYRDRDSLEGLVGEMLEARESDHGDPSGGIRAWLAAEAEKGYVPKYMSDWMLSGRDVSADDVAALVNCIWSEDGLWDGGYEERRQIALALVGSLEREGLDCDGLDPDDLADQLRDRFGLESVWVTGADVAAMVFPTTLLVGDRPHGRSVDDVSRSRHTFDAAKDYLWALDDARPGDPAPTLGDGDCRVDGDEVGNSNLQWLCETQGTTLEDVLTPGSGHWDTPFAKALRREVLESEGCLGGWPYVAVLVEMTVGEHLALTAAMWDEGAPLAGVMVKDAMVGVHDPVNGAGGVLDLGNWGGTRIMAPFCLPATMVQVAMLDGRGRGGESYAGFWTVRTTHDLVAECWADARTELLSGDDPRLAAAYEAAVRTPGDGAPVVSECLNVPEADEHTSASQDGPAL